MIKQLKHYAEVDLPTMCDRVVRELAERGIRVAEYSVSSDFRPYIDFRFDSISLGKGELVGSDISLIHRIWYTSKNNGNEKSADISPLLMSEFGAGWYALPGRRGTFPGQKHAFESVWYWYDASGNKHSSDEDYLMIPTQPMYRAMVEMMQNVERVVREVFSEYGYGVEIET